MKVQTNPEKYCVVAKYELTPYEAVVYKQSFEDIKSKEGYEKLYDKYSNLFIQTAKIIEDPLFGVYPEHTVLFYTIAEFENENHAKLFAYSLYTQFENMFIGNDNLMHKHNGVIRANIILDPEFYIKYEGSKRQECEEYARYLTELVSDTSLIVGCKPPDYVVIP